MTAEFLCPGCADWPLEPDDRFCGHCGALVCLDEVSIDVSRDRPGRPPTLRLKAMPSNAAQDQAREGDDLKFAIRSIDGRGRETHRRDIPAAGAIDRAGIPLTRETIDLERNPSQVLAVRAAIGQGERQSIGRDRLAVFIGDDQPASEFALIGGQLLMDAITPVETGAELKVRIRNEGGAAMVSSARMRLDGVAGAETTGPGLEQAVFAPPGEAVVLPAWMSHSEFAASRVRAGEVGATLEIKADRLWSERIVLRRWTAPSAKLEVAPKIQALAGRPARLAARLTNSGGATLSVAAVEARMAPTRPALDDAPWVQVPTPLAWRKPLAAGSAADVEVRPVMPSLDAGPGAASEHRVIEVRVRFDAASSVPAPDVHDHAVVAVFRPRPFVGRICIDFGTTETAAAAIAGAEPVRPDSRTTPPDSPFIVELGAVLLADERAPQGGRFIETLVVVTEDGAIRCGDEALMVLEFAASAERGVLATPCERIVDDGIHRSFKWSLSQDPEIPIAFLRHVKALIEEHPRVAAEVGPGTVMFATCPNRFADHQREALHDAFTGAGFPDPLTTWFDVEHGEQATFIAESWSPIPYALYDEETRFRSLGEKMEKREVLPPLDDGQSGHVVIYDVGGGSADFSVLEVRQKDGDRWVKEIARETSTKFAGLPFGALIGEAIRAWAKSRGWVIDSSPGAKAQFDRAVNCFQRKPGLLSSSLLETRLSQYFANWAVLPIDERHQAANSLFNEIMFGGGDTLRSNRDRLIAEMAPFLPLSFGAGNTKAMITLADIPQVAGDVLWRFAEQFHDELVKLDTSDLKKRLAEHDNGPARARLIPSGRGAACPLADALILHCWSDQTKAGMAICRLPVIESKSITSWGGLHLCDLARLGDGLHIEFGALTDDLWIDAGSRALPISLPWIDDDHTVALTHLDGLSIDARRFRTVRILTGRAAGGTMSPVFPITFDRATAESSSRYWVGVKRVNGRFQELLIEAEDFEAAKVQAKAGG